MKNAIVIKFVNPKYAENELNNIGFDDSYRHHAAKKNSYKTIKMLNLSPQEASILKQSALALGFDAAVNRGVIDCSVDYSDALLTGSLVQFEKLARSISRQPFRLKWLSTQLAAIFSNNLTALKLKNTTFDWSKPYLMGILNITPDSFSDGGDFFSVETALKHFKTLVDDGADIIDIGAESTRPGHRVLTPDEELARLKPVLTELKKLNSGISISVDTRNVKTAEIALELGADIINDVGFSGYNKEMISFVNANNVPYIVMHNQNIQNNLVDDVYCSLSEILQKITAPVIADIGIGFGKTVEQNFELLNRAEEFKSLGVPLLVGHSRKSFLFKTFDFTRDELDEATTAISTQLISSGVNILRIHDVRRHKLALNVISKLTNA